jgi:hypothetical protein
LPVKNGHVILYRAGDDTRIDRANIALLKRVVQKSTTPVFLEIYYHAPAQLLSWSEPQERVRYIRLRSGEQLPVAERITTSAGKAVLVLNDSVWLAATDIWHLLGHSPRQSLVVLKACRILKNPGESFPHYFLREAFMRLKAYLFPQGYFIPENHAVNPGLFCEERKISRKSFHEKMAFAGLSEDLAAQRPFVLPGRSYALRGVRDTRLMKTAAETVIAIKSWRDSKKFPWWFSPRHFLFHVAQISAYLGALAALVSIPAGLILLAFAILITPRFFFAGLSLRRPWLWPVCAVSRVVVYFFG